MNDVPQQTAAEKPMTFEEAMAALEKTVSEMERGGVPLEEMLSRFEEGTRLARYCQEKLASLRKRMELLTVAPDGSTAWRPMTQSESEASGELRG